MSHVIRQLVLHVDLAGTEAEGLTLNGSLSALCRDAIVPVIEETLNRRAPSDAFVQIDRLDVDAGEITPKNLETDLADEIVKAIGEALADHPTIQRVAADAESASRGGSASHKQPGVRWKNPREGVLDAFSYYLLHGRLPWSYRLSAGETLEQAVHKHLAGNSPQSLPDVQLLSALTSPDARRRLVRQFSTKFVHDLVGSVAPEISGTVQSISNHVSQHALTDSSVLMDSLWDAALSEMSTGKRALSEKRLAAMTLRTADLIPADARTALRRLAEGGGSDIADRTGPEKVNKDMDLSGNETNVDIRRQGTSLSPTEQTHDSPPYRAMQSEEPIYVDNAGLVILHPFLSMFFEAVGAVSKRKVQLPDHTLGLLHYLGTGQENAPEQELVIPKLLCGLDPETVQAGCTSLTDSEKSEAGALLAAVIRHWEALRNTTADGLRGTFLLRPGKLSLRSDGDWLLQVETKSFDFLMDQLPWGISMIQLPWMKKILRVEWDVPRV
jgi:hypothetical protein